MKLSYSEGRLHGTMKNFQVVWERSQEEWQDQRRAEFEKQYVQEMEGIIKMGGGSIAELSEILGSIIKKCS